MSRIGKQPVTVPEKVKVTLVDGTFEAQGPLGKEGVSISALVDIDIKGDQITVIRKKDDKNSRGIHGLMRVLISNAVHGVSKGFQKDLEINGVGYRAEVKGKKLNLNLGYSHVVEFAIPEGIKIAVQNQTNVSVSGSNKELVGRTASQIRSKRPPEPYKGKGVKYKDETILRKVGKSAAGGK
ncbi:50S ribosomal protein L6 [bacterium K02(2017)]|nr:50S ribosomal protein L6 [bacterium K02(2017)]